MKLWGSLTSPYVRKVRAIAEHHQLPVELMLLEGSAFEAKSRHNHDNPLGKIPALQTDEGLWLCDSHIIAEYLDDLGQNTKLYPHDTKRFIQLNTVALAHGILDNTTALVLPEKMFRPEHEWWHARHEQIFERNQRSLRVLAEQLKPYGETLNLAALVGACVVDYFLFRDALLGMGETIRALQLDQWNEAMLAKHACLRNTRPPQA